MKEKERKKEESLYLDLCVFLLQLKDFVLPRVPDSCPDEAALFPGGQLLLIDSQRVGVDHPLDRLHPGKTDCAREGWETPEDWRHEAGWVEAVVRRGRGFW